MRGRAAGVVAHDLVPIGLVEEPLIVELRRVLDLVLRPVDEDLLLVDTHRLDDACREHHLLAEDPRPGVDDDEPVHLHVARPLVDLADAAVRRLDLEADEVGCAPRGLAPRCDLQARHADPLSWIPIAYPGSPGPNIGATRRPF